LIIWFLMLVVAVGAMAALIWNYQRKAAEREAASNRRFEEMLKSRPSAATVAASPTVAAPAAAAAAAKPAAPAVAAAVKGRFLGQPQTLVFRLLKAAISDHEIFANVALVSVIGSRNEQEARRLAPYRLDFVVCDKAMQVVSVVEMDGGGGQQDAGERQFKAESLKAAAIRLVRIDATKPPRREEIRVLVCGQPGSHS
jgi:uncharacterized protein DUF2726